MKEEQKLRGVIRDLIKEELTPSVRRDLAEQMETALRETMENLFMQESVHKQGLSTQQNAYLYKRMCKVVENVLEDYTSTRKPNDLPYDEYIDKV